MTRKNEIALPSWAHVYRAYRKRSRLPCTLCKIGAQRKCPLSYVWIVSTAVTAAAEDTGSGWHSLRLCALRPEWHVFDSRRLPSSSPSRCRQCRESLSLSGDDSPNRCLSEVTFVQRATTPTSDANREPKAKKKRSAHGTELAPKFVFHRYRA